MKINTIKKSLKLAAFSLFMVLGIQNVHANPGSWSEWFTIDSISYMHMDTIETGTDHATLRIIPEASHTIHNPMGCSNSDSYEPYPLYMSQFSATAAIGELTKQQQKLITLAFTAGYQIRVYVLSNICSPVNNRPRPQGIQIKK